MSNLHKTTILLAFAGAFLCAGSAEPDTGTLRAEVRTEPTINTKPTQLRCRIYFGCAPAQRSTGTVNQF